MYNASLQLVPMGRVQQVLPSTGLTCGAAGWPSACAATGLMINLNRSPGLRGSVAEEADTRSQPLLMKNAKSTSENAKNECQETASLA
jgi:hypothetical protein